MAITLYIQYIINDPHSYHTSPHLEREPTHGLPALTAIAYH